MLNASILTEAIEKIRQEHNIVGMSVAVTDRQGTVYKAGFGCQSTLQPKIATHPDAMYKIASMTKTVTAVVVLRLCQDGVLDLDTPVKYYLPGFTLSCPKAVETMTLRHLLTHTSGLYADDWLEEGTHDETCMNGAICAVVPVLPMVGLPGEGKYCYSNWGYNIIAWVVTSVTGKGLTELYQEYVLRPMGMERTTFDYQAASSYLLSMPHTCDANGKSCQDSHQRINMAYAGGAGLYSNAEDMCKWARFLLRDGVTDDGLRLLSPESVIEFYHKHTPKTDAPGSFYGLGLFISPFKDRFIYGHTGNYDPYNSSIFVDKKTGVGVVTLYNTNNIRETDPRYMIPEMIFSMMG